MYTRIATMPESSFFLLGPRGTGKSTWLRAALQDAVWFDLLDSDVYTDLLGAPSRLGRRLPKGFTGWVVIDEIQRIPELLHEVHRLIETGGPRFALTGSSARKLRRGGTNLLAGRALARRMHPLVRSELAGDWELRRAVQLGGLPSAWNAAVQIGEGQAVAYLASYVGTYLREEVQQEGIARNLPAFARFLEAASFSQAAALNVAAVARDCAVERKVVESWFGVLEDLLLAVRLPVFARRATRDTVTHPKLFFFDVGVFRAIRPRGPLDSAEEIDGAAIETLLFQQVRALNETLGLGYELSWWRTRTGLEVDLVLYGERGLIAFELKRSSRVHAADLRGLEAFREEYPPARLFLLYGGERAYRDGDIHILPLGDALDSLPSLLAGAAHD